MGYEFHITRAECWADNEGFQIEPEEWLNIINNDPELKLNTINGEYFAQWNGKCSYPDGAWFNYDYGNINTKTPDKAIMLKMLQLADKLNAKIIGDDGEIITEDNINEYFSEVKTVLVANNTKTQIGLFEWLKKL